MNLSKYFRFSVIVLFLVFAFSCNRIEEKVTPIQEAKKQIAAQRGSSNNRTMYFNGLKKETESLGERLSYQNGKVSYTIARSTSEYLNDNYFHLNNADSIHTALSNNLNFSSPVSVEDVLSKYTSQQQVLLEPFFQNLKGISEDLSEVENIVSNFHTQIKNSNMSIVEKEQLQHIADGTLSIKDFLNDGGIDDIKGQLGNMLERGCSVSVRGVLVDAVVTGAVSGIGGAWVGGIKGAVFGFAGGFLTGGLCSVASQLIQTCFR